MSFRTKIIDLAEKTRKEMLKLEDKVKWLEGMRDEYSDNKYREEMEKLTESKESVRREAMNQAKELINAFSSSIHIKCRASSEEIDEGDLALLNSGIHLTGAECCYMFDNYKGNFTMQRLIDQYVKDHEVSGFDRELMSEERIRLIAERSTSLISNVASRPTFDEFLEEDYLSEVLPEVLDLA